MHKKTSISQAEPPRTAARAEFIAGFNAITPIIMGIAPFGIICGAAAMASGLSAWQAFAMSWIIFAGSAQITTLQLLASGAPLLVIISTAAIINLRFMMYSASLAPQFGTLNHRWQTLLAYLLTDQSYALTIGRAIESKNNTELRWYCFGASSAVWVWWQLATIVGILLGSLTPQDWSLDFIMPLTFIAMLMPLLNKRAMWIAALAGGAASVLLTLPLKLDLIAAAFIGIAAGLLAERQHLKEHKAP